VLYVCVLYYIRTLCQSYLLNAVLMKRRERAYFFTRVGSGIIQVYTIKAVKKYAFERLTQFCEQLLSVSFIFKFRIFDSTIVLVFLLVMFSTFGFLGSFFIRAAARLIQNLPRLLC